MDRVGKSESIERPTKALLFLVFMGFADNKKNAKLIR